MKQVRHFTALVFLLSFPLWIVGYLFDATKVIPIKLPVSALQFICVLVAAIIVTRRNGESVRVRLRRGIDIGQITHRGWRYGIFLIMPVTVWASYLLMQWRGLLLPGAFTPVWNIPLFALIYTLSGYCEEIGWTAVATDQLLTRYSIVQTGFMVGILWAVWHIIPFVQTHTTTEWIFWQCVYTIVSRIVLTKMYVLTNRSVWTTIVLHATYNTAFSMMPYYGSSYNPMYMTLATCLTGGIIFLLYRKERQVFS